MRNQARNQLLYLDDRQIDSIFHFIITLNFIREFSIS